MNTFALIIGVGLIIFSIGMLVQIAHTAIKSNKFIRDLEDFSKRVQEEIEKETEKEN